MGFYLEIIWKNTTFALVKKTKTTTMAKNVFQYSAVAEANWKANLGDMSSYKPKYTFYSDFAIAEFYQVYGRESNAILDTYNRVIESWSGSYEALTEIILVLNHKIWAFFQDVDTKYLGISKEKGKEIARIYNELWQKAGDLFFKLYENNSEAMSHYYEVTD